MRGHPLTGVFWGSSLMLNGVLMANVQDENIILV